MYSTCLHCTRDLGRNEMVETLPIGRRLAFDADQGRLWVVCSACGKWNLVPFDTRLESIDACERLFRDTRTRYSTDNIGMAKVGDGLTLVRVGKALRPEFASWRYGEQYKRRRRAVLTGSVAAGGVCGIAVMAAGVGLSLAAGVSTAGAGAVVCYAGRAAFNHVIGRRARVRTFEPGSETPLTISMAMLKASRITWQDGAPPSLLVPRKPGSPRYGYHSWDETTMPAMGRRIAGGLNLATGTAGEIRGAVDRLAHEAGDLSRWLRQEATLQRYRSVKNITRPDVGWELEPDRTLRIADVAAVDRLALEMWFSEQAERRWLEGELRLLEREWREAEKLAKIADRLVLDDAGLDTRGSV